MPQSLVMPARPPSVTTTSSGIEMPVVQMTRHSDLAIASSRRASTMTTSACGASTRAEASAGRMRTWWDSSPSAGTTSALGAKVFVSSSRWAIVDQDRRSCDSSEGVDRVTETVLVRYWAGARAAAGRRRGAPRRRRRRSATSLARLTAAHPALDAVLPVCSVLVGGRASAGDDPVPPGAVVEVLPPFAGG